MIPARDLLATSGSKRRHLESVFVPDHPNNIEILWEDPALSRFLERLASMGG
jgi:hypothetical protein